MSMSSLTKLLTLALLALCTISVAQQKAAVKNTDIDEDTATVPLDSMKWRKYIPTGIRIGTDAITIARNYYDNTFQGWEFNGDVDLHHYLFAVDYGRWSRTFNSNFAADTISGTPPGSEHYTNEGNYFRIGADVNFLRKDPDKNIFFFGFRYGHSRFTETLLVNKQDPTWGDLNINGPLVNSDFTAHWFELTTGLRVKMYKIFWMGYTARFKFGLGTNEKGAMVPSDIPGYGRTDKESTWGFNYQLFIRIPVRKAPPSLDLDKK
jgi:hypothetical protein